MAIRNISAGSVAASWFMGTYEHQIAIEPHETGDLLLIGVAIQDNSGPAITTPTGWALWTDTGTSGPPRMRLYYRVATSNATPNVVFPYTNNAQSSYSGFYLRFVYRGVDKTNPVGPTATAAYNSTVAPSVTLAKAGLLISYFGAYAGGTSPRVHEPPSGMTERIEVSWGGSRASLHDQIVGTGPTGTRALGGSGTDYNTWSIAASLYAASGQTQMIL